MIKALNKDDPMWGRVSLQALEAKANAVAFDFAAHGRIEYMQAQTFPNELERLQ